VKNYNLETRSGQRSLINKTVSQAIDSRLPNLPQGTTQHIVIDARGQNVSNNALAKIAQNMEASSGGVISSNNVHFMQGAKASPYQAVARVGGRAIAVVGVATDVYSIATAQNKLEAASSAAGGWVGATAGAKGGAAVGAGVGVWFGGVGAVPGAVIGGVVGGIGGYVAGSWAGQSIYNFFR
jgi:hypothetical protein